MKEMNKIGEVSLSDTRMAVARDVLLKIAEKNEGRIAPESIVEVAKEPEHPLHGYFEWDDTEAARRFRLAQASFLIRRIKLTVIRQERKAKQLKVSISQQRAFESNPADRKRGGNGSYMEVGELLSDPERRASLLASALAELNAIKRRYEQLDELASVWIAVAEVRNDT